MVAIPRAPGQFLSEYLPGRMAEAAGALGVTSSSAGSVTFRITDRGEEYSLWLDQGRLVCSTGMAEDTLVQVSLTADDFELLFVTAAEREAAGTFEPERHLLALRALGMDQEQAKLLREAVGSVALVIREGDLVHRVVFTPGSTVPELDHATCRIQLEYQDFVAMQSGTVVPLQLLLAGKILIDGNAQVLAALGGALAGP